MYRFNRFNISQWGCLSVVPLDNVAINIRHVLKRLFQRVFPQLAHFAR